MRLFLLAHLAATLFLTGLIWFVQVVHYPLFGAVGPESFPAYQAAHQVRTSWVVVVPMLLELGTGLWLLLNPPAGTPRAGWAVGASLIAVIWLSTFLLQVPAHTRLLGGFEASTHALLVGSNWIRALAWTARSALLLWLLDRQLSR
jgi:hypothetical protein